MWQSVRTIVSMWVIPHWFGILSSWAWTWANCPRLNLAHAFLEIELSPCILGYSWSQVHGHKHSLFSPSINPFTPINPSLTTGFTGLVGKVRKKLSPERRKGGWRKKARAACPPGPGLEPGTCRVLGEGHQLQAMGAVLTSKPFSAYR